MTNTTVTPRPVRHDSAVAEMTTTATGQMGGILHYLAIRTVDINPGT